MTTTSDGRPFGTLLKGWRERAGMSQLELALRADSSARHISFMETGRTTPSRGMVLRLAEQLDVPVRERNALLLRAGHAPHFTETALDDEALSGLRNDLKRMVTAYEPYPALVLTGCYEVVAANRGIGALLEGVSPALLEPPLNAMRITLHPQGLAPRIRNFTEWRGHLLHQMRRQLAPLRSAPLRALYEEVAAYPPPASDRPLPASGSRTSAGTEDTSAGTEEAPRPFALPMVVDVRGRELSFLSTVATFNTPLDITVSELAVETFLPADGETAAALGELLPP